MLSKSDKIWIIAGLGFGTLFICSSVPFRYDSVDVYYTVFIVCYVSHFSHDCESNFTLLYRRFVSVKIERSFSGTSRV